MDDTIARIKSQTGKTVVVETYDAIPADIRGDYTKATSDAFYDRWLKSRGKATQSDVMILITRDPSHLVIGESEANRNSGVFTSADHKAVAQQILAAFKTKDFDGGIVAGVKSIEQRLSDNAAAKKSGAGASAAGSSWPSNAPSSQSPAAGQQSRSSSPAYPSATPRGGNWGFGSLLCVGIAVIALFMLVKGIFSRARQQQQPPYGTGPFSQGGQGNYPPPLPPGAQYGQGYGGGGGGFGRGVAGGLLGGVLGSVIGNQVFGQGRHHESSDSSSSFAPGPDPAGTDSSSAGGDFGGGGDSFGGGGDFGGGGGDFGGGGGDSSSGGDF